MPTMQIFQFHAPISQAYKLLIIYIFIYSCMSICMCICYWVVGKFWECLDHPLAEEAERIKQSSGRIFALKGEPSVQRVWLPYHDSPGLAMARAFGDFQLKDYGIIATPEITHHHLTCKDKFIILATDGVWTYTVSITSKLYRDAF